jgi:multidrug efflux system membrane fusion protein
VVVTQLQPITVVFSVAEDYLSQIEPQLRQGRRMSVTALDRTQQQKLAEGSLLTIDNQIDQTTGTVKLKAIFANSNFALFPNEFVNAKLLVETQKGVDLVPTAAIQRNSQSAFVYVITPGQRATIRTVTVGATDGTVAAVQGVQPGETVATNGFDKLQDGASVTVRTGSRTSSNSGGDSDSEGP